MDSGAIIAIVAVAMSALGGLATVYSNLTAKLVKAKDAHARLDTRVAVLETDYKHLNEGLTKEMGEVKQAIKEIASDLDEHMKHEPKQLKEILGGLIHSQLREVFVQELRRVADLQQRRKP